MGLLRTIFAMAVIFDHAWPTGFMFVGGRNAVQCFYIISGFLISYILVERRSYSTLPAFYVNRYLRLYPIYCFVGLVTLTLIIATHRPSFFHVYQMAPLGAVCLLIFSNTFLLGQDWIMFAAVRNHALEFTTDFHQSDVLLFEGQVIHPSWTLGVELTFYAIAPFLLPRRRLIYALLAASLCLRVWFIHLGFGTRDPWTYRFFPTELALFLMGALAHQLLLPAYRRLSARTQVHASNAGTVLLVALSLAYFLIPIEEPYKRLGLLSVFACLVPLTFMFQQRHSWDAWVGNLSYPVYIGHMLVLEVCSYLMKRAGILDQRAIALVCVALTVAFAAFLNAFVGSPIEKLRNRLRSRRPRGAMPAAVPGAP